MMSKRQTGVRKSQSPQNFIVKHAKVHRSQIDRDNLEVKALFSFLSQIYRAGCVGDDAADDHLQDSNFPLNENTYQLTHQYQSESVDYAASMPNRAKFEMKKSACAVEILGNFFFSRRSIFPSTSLQPKSHRDVLTTFVEHCAVEDVSMKSKDSNDVARHNHDDGNREVSSVEFLSSLRETGYLPLQILLGSIPGVDISDQQLPLTSSFIAAMLYLESVGEGFDWMRFGDSTYQMLNNSPIVSTDATCSEVRIPTVEEECVPLESVMRSSDETIRSACYTKSDGVEGISHSKDIDEGNSEYNSNRSPDDDEKRASQRAHYQSQSNDDLFNIRHASNDSHGEGRGTKFRSTGKRDRGELDGHSGNSDSASVDIMSSAQNAHKKSQSSICDTSDCIEAVAAFLQSEMPPTHVIDAAFDYIGSHSRMPLTSLLKEGQCTLMIDPTHAVQDGLFGGSVVGGDSHPSPTSVMAIVRPQKPSIEPFADSISSAVNCNVGYKEFNGYTDGAVCSTQEVDVRADVDVTAPIQHTRIEFSMEQNHNTVSCEISSSSAFNIGHIQHIGCNTVGETSAIGTDDATPLAIPPFNLSILALSPEDLAVLTAKYEAVNEHGLGSGNRLHGVEDALSYIIEISNSYTNRFSGSGTCSGASSSSSSSSTSAVSECHSAIATSALQSISRTLLLSNRILDLRDYPLYSPSIAPHVLTSNISSGLTSCDPTSSDASVDPVTYDNSPEFSMEREMRKFAAKLHDMILMSNTFSHSDLLTREGSSWDNGCIHPLNSSTAPYNAPCASPQFSVPNDFLNMSDTSGAVALLALMADCVCSSEFDCYFDDVTPINYPTHLKRERDDGGDAKRWRLVDEINPDQLTSRRQQRCPRCGEFKKGHICKYRKDPDAVSPKIETLQIFEESMA